MNARERRERIQTHLSHARALAAAGNRTDALAQVDSALAIDTENVAAHVLRERILSRAANVHPKADPTVEAEDRPLVSMEGLARFEGRARQRRVERRLEAARAAIRSRRFNEARTALAEVRDLDASRPELTAMTLDLDAGERARAMRAAGGPLAAAAATFAGITLSASLIGNTGFLQSYPMSGVAGLAPSMERPLLSTELVTELPVATTGDDPFAPSIAPSFADPLLGTLAEIGIERPAATFVESPPAGLAIASAPAAAVDGDIERDDAQQVRALLQQYRAAYDQLDAHLARAVWPDVNEAALARAFDGLESQTLTFEDCDVQLRGSTASARCTGSTSYVPKVGSRALRVEPLVWNLTLRKIATDWHIETARTDP